MNDERKKKLIGYLYTNEKLCNFICRNIYCKLLKILPKKICISVDSFKDISRNENLDIAKNIVINFLKDNSKYVAYIKSFYNEKQFDSIVNDVIMGYLLYLTTIKDACRRIDIFRDKRSICYSPISIIDIM